MRLEGLMKLLKGDKTDLRHVKYFHFFLVFLFIASADTYSQLPLNGFCSFRNIKVNTSFEKIFTLDFDGDNQSDFLIYNPINNNIALQKNNAIDNKITSISRYAQISITDIKPVIRIRKKELFYFAISQKDRKAALFSISKSGGMWINLQHKFNSYPSVLAVADMNGDGNSEAIVAGNNFEGISLFFLKNDLAETKIVEKGAYSSIQFIDLNYDGFPDIAAYESRKNCLYFFLNDQNGNFREARNLRFDPSVKSFKTADVNSDGYADLVLIKQKGITIIEGDSVSSFKKNYSVRMPVTPDEIVIDDFNTDGINDLSFMNKASGEFFVQINKGNGNYFYPVLMLKRNKLSDLKSFRDSFSKKIVLLNPEGELYVFSKSSIKKELEKISASGDCSAITAFNFRNNEKKDIAVVDNYQKALIILLSEPGNPFAKYYSARTSSSFDKIITSDSKKNEKVFFLYSDKSNLIEIIKYNFETNSIDKNTLYVKGNIIDLKIKPVGNSDYPNIYVLSDKAYPGYAVYQFKGFHYSEISSSKLGGSFMDAAITSNDTLSIITWIRSYYGCEKYSFGFKGANNGNLIYKYENKIQDDFELYTGTYPVNDKNGYLIYSLIRNEKNIECVIYEAKRLKNISIENGYRRPASFGKESFYLFQNVNDKRKIFFIYDFGNSIFYKADLNSKARIMSLRGGEKIEDIASYVVDKSAGKKLRVIFIDRNDKSINIKEIE